PLHAQAPCIRDAVAVRAVVEAAGRERFAVQAARYEGDLAAADADQVVWHGLTEALGFSRNARPFRQLAEAVPWAEAQAVVRERGVVALAGLLLGMAGLIARATLPEAHAWRRLQRQRGLRVALERGSWDRAALRAANAPEQRCRGLAELAARWAEAARAPCWLSLAEQALAAVREAAGVRPPAPRASD